MPIEIHNEIMLDYQNIQHKNKRKKEAELEKIHMQIPRLKELELLMAQIGVDLCRALIRRDKSFLVALKEKSLKFKSEKDEILEANGLAESYDKPIFSCKKCEDTGFSNGAKCSCYLQKMIERHTKISGLGELSKSDRFQNFKLNYYPKTLDVKKGISAFDNSKLIFETCKNFCESFGKKDSLFLYGDTGLGKTFICNCIANELLENGHSVVYYTAPSLFKLCEEFRFNRANVSEDIRDLIYSCELLIIDDLGTEFSNIVSDSELFQIINFRLINKLPVIVSTNLGIAAFKEHYSERIYSRIYGNYLFMEFFGNDIRILKKFE